MVPNYADRPIVVMGQGATAEAALDATDGAINSRTSTAGILFAPWCPGRERAVEQ